MKTTTLYFKEGSSDKVYQASIVQQNGGFVVNFAYGRRGSTLNTGTKTSSPVDLPSAEKIFDKLVREKKAKGYTEGPNGTPYTSEESKEYSGVQPQLLNPIEEDQIEPYILNPDWAMQEKFDGKRLLLLKQGNAVRGINRKGLYCSIPQPIMNDALKVNGDFLIDGECVGDLYYAFDMLKIGTEDLRDLGYCWRLDNLNNVLRDLGPGSIRRAITLYEQQEKRDYLALLRKVQVEGVVFKEVNAPYTAGRPNSGGTQLKCKFYATASFVVLAVNKQRSVLLGLNKDGVQVPAGNVTVPPNQAIPKVGEVVEVRYLYALQQSGSVYQPTLLGRRGDVDPNECTVSQLKYRPATGEQESEE
jgi:bifunctional non-homologous end joining protein LigD